MSGPAPLPTGREQRQPGPSCSGCPPCAGRPAHRAEQEGDGGPVRSVAAGPRSAGPARPVRLGPQAGPGKGPGRHLLGRPPADHPQCPADPVALRARGPRHPAARDRPRARRCRGTATTPSGAPAPRSSAARPPGACRRMPRASPDRGPGGAPPGTWGAGTGAPTEPPGAPGAPAPWPTGCWSGAPRTGRADAGGLRARARRPARRGGRHRAQAAPYPLPPAGGGRRDDGALRPGWTGLNRARVTAAGVLPCLTNGKGSESRS